MLTQDELDYYKVVAATSEKEGVLISRLIEMAEEYLKLIDKKKEDDFSNGT